MDGRDISAGSVGTAKAIENAVKIATQIMEGTDHVMIVSDRITKLFDNTVEEYPHDVNEKTVNKYNSLIKNFRIKWKKNRKLMMLSSMASQEKIINIILL
ncbi:MAG: isoaspartyl peptidase/L-asparaginase [Nitrososphaeraceae archaeon]